MKILKEKFLREEELQDPQIDEIEDNSIEDIAEEPSTEGAATSEPEIEEPTGTENVEPTKTVWKVNFTLGNHENWSRFESETKEEAEREVTKYVTNKWPNREFKIIDTEEYVEEDELEEQLNESLENNPMEANKIFVNGEPYITFEKGTPQDEIDKIAYQLKNILGTKEVRVVYEDGSTYNMKVEALEESLGEITDAQPIETGAEVGMATVISDLIKDEYEAIDGYNSAIATAEAEGFEDLVNVLTEIQAEENLHIGQLQAVMNTLDPNAHLVDDGQQEGIEQLANPIATDNTIEEDIEPEQMSRADSEAFDRAVREKWDMSPLEFIQEYNAGRLPMMSVNSYEDIPNCENAIELDSLDISQGTGNVIVYTYMEPETGKLYKYASY